MKKLFIIGLLISLAVCCNSLQAMDLGISPPDVWLKLNPGGVYQGQIYIMGSKEEEVAINTYLMDWSLNSAGEYQFLPKGTLKRSASPWITFTPSQFKLLPGKGQRVNYTVKAPLDASGSYWSVLMFSTIPRPLDANAKFQIAAAARVAYIIKVDINGSRAGKGKIERFKLNYDEGVKKVAATVRIKNSGETSIRFKGRLELKDVQGRIVGAIPFNEGIILPDLSREFVLSDQEIALGPGFYIGLAILDLGERTQQAVQGTLNIK